MRRPRMTHKMANDLVSAAIHAVSYYEGTRNTDERKLERTFERVEDWTRRNRAWLEWKAQQRKEGA